MRWIIVTGDSGVLGNNIVNVLLNEDEIGVVGISRRLTDEIVKLQEANKDKYIHINYDLYDSEGIKKLYLNKIKKIGVLGGFVNNAAIAYDDIITNANINKLSDMYKINVLTPIMLTKYTIRDMLLNSVPGSIIHISSVCAHTGYKGLGMYASTKGALEAFSRTTAREWGERGIRSNCVAPGFMETSMSSTLNYEQKDRIYKRTSLKSDTKPNSVAETVSFLISDAASSITGTVIHVDNGTI